MQQIQLNIIPFQPVVNKGRFAFYGEKQKGFTSIKWDKLFEQFPEGKEANLKFNHTVLYKLNNPKKVIRLLQ